MMTLKVYVCFTDLKSMVVVRRYSIFTISRSGGSLEWRDVAKKTKMLYLLAISIDLRSVKHT